MSGLRINTNLAAITAQGSLSEVTGRIAKSTEKLSSGVAINRAADNVAGLAVSERMRSQVNGLQQAQRNAQDAASLLDVLDGGYATVVEHLQRIRALAVQSASDTYTDEDREAIDAERDELMDEIDRLYGTVEFNGKKLFQGTTNDNAAKAAASTGSALGVPWTALQTAINNLATGVDQSVTFTVSFMMAGLDTDEAGNTTAFGDQVDFSPGAAAFQGEVMAAFNEWKAVFEGTYSEANGSGADLTMNIVNLGDETGISQPSNFVPSYGLPHADNIGDFRIGMSPVGAPLAHAFSPAGTPGVTGSLGGDVHFDSADDWRLDGAIDPGAFSVMMVAAHEIGHSFGLGHDTSGASILFAFVGAGENFSTKFPNGLLGSDTDVGSVMNRYGVPPGVADGDLTFQVGANAGETIVIERNTVTTAELGIGAISLATRTSAENAIASLDSAIRIMAGNTAQAGALSRRVGSAFDFAEVSKINQASAMSRIRDLDFASEIVSLTKDQILQQSGTAALAQANIFPRSVLNLLSG